MATSWVGLGTLADQRFFEVGVGHEFDRLLHEPVGIGERRHCGDLVDLDVLGDRCTKRWKKWNGVIDALRVVDGWAVDG